MGSKMEEIQDFLTLQCSLYRLAKKCFKICLNVPKSKKYNHSLKREIFYHKNNPNYQEVENQFLYCVSQCSEEYVKMHNYTRERFLEELNETQEYNQKLFDSYYSDSK